MALPSSEGGFSNSGLISNGSFQGRCQRFEFDCAVFVPLSSSSTATTVLSTVSACDDCGQMVTLPFMFMWLGYYPVTQVFVTSNGYINIDKNNNPSVAVGYSAVAISHSSSSLPSGISLAHEDLRPSASSSARILTSYSMDSFSFTISYQQVPFYPAAGTMSAQAVLFKNGAVDLRWGGANLSGLSLLRNYCPQLIAVVASESLQENFDCLLQISTRRRSQHLTFLRAINIYP